MIGMSKAAIKIASGDSGMLSATISTSSAGECKCLFNPAEFSIQRAANYAEHKVPGLDRPILQFLSGEAEVMKFSLFFDTYSAGLETGNMKLMINNTLPILMKPDVRDFSEPFYKLLNVNESKHMPDMVSFEWGKTKFVGYVTDISQKFTMFSPQGVPLRATLDITLKSSRKDNNIRNSPDRTKHRVVKSGDRLYGFAFREYDDCSEWRRIAEANKLDNPRKLKSGSHIVVPPIL